MNIVKSINRYRYYNQILIAYDRVRKFLDDRDLHGALKEIQTAHRMAFERYQSESGIFKEVEKARLEEFSGIMDMINEQLIFGGQIQWT